MSEVRASDIEVRQRTVELTRYTLTTCERCDGSGKENCYECRGTGIGQHGDPDTSKCGACKGRGWNWCKCAEDAKDAADEAKLDAERDGD